MRYTLLLGATALSFFSVSSNAYAEPQWPNWYVGLHGSMVFIDEVEVTGNPTLNEFEQDTGWGIGAALGYRPAFSGGNWRNIRVEGEWIHQRSEMDKVKAFTGSFNGDGDVRLNAYMMNLFFDATFRDPELRSTLVPYFGGGAGFATLKLDDTGADLGNIAEEDHVFAFQLMAGVSYAPEVMPNVEWTFGYRYLTTTDAEFAYTAGGTMEVDYDSHNLEAGMRFLF